MSASRAQQRLWRNVYGDTLNAFPCRREIPVEQLSELLRMVWQPEKFTVREPEPSISRPGLNKQLRQRYRKAASPACLRFPGPGAPPMKVPDAQSRSLRGKHLLRDSCPFRIPLAGILAVCRVDVRREQSDQVLSRAAIGGPRRGFRHMVEARLAKDRLSRSHVHAASFPRLTPFALL